jgi:hypothetical protein
MKLDRLKLDFHGQFSGNMTMVKEKKTLQSHELLLQTGKYLNPANRDRSTRNLHA